MVTGDETFPPRLAGSGSGGLISVRSDRGETCRTRSGVTVCSSIHLTVLHLSLDRKLTLFERIFRQPHASTPRALTGGSGHNCGIFLGLPATAGFAFCGLPAFLAGFRRRSSGTLHVYFIFLRPGPPRTSPGVPALFSCPRSTVQMNWLPSSAGNVDIDDRSEPKR